jgi:hypothetical protein
MSLMGQSRPSNSVSGPPFVRCWSNSNHYTAEFVCPLCANSELLHRSKLNLYLITPAEISLGEAAPEQHTNQHKIRHICIIGF